MYVYVCVCMCVCVMISLVHLLYRSIQEESSTKKVHARVTMATFHCFLSHDFIETCRTEAEEVEEER